MPGTILLIAALLIGALLLIAAEICTPSLGVLTMGAIACLAYMVYMVFTEFGPAAGIVSIVVLVFVMPAYVWLAIKYLPQTAVGRVLQLAARRRDPGEGTPDAGEQKAYLGRTGLAETPLRPSGAIRVGKERVIATAETGFIEKGATVKVIKAVGMNVVVRQVDQQT